jgi:hypothetical protein
MLDSAVRECDQSRVAPVQRASFRVSAPAIRTHIRSGRQSRWSRSALATCGQMRA